MRLPGNTVYPITSGIRWFLPCAAIFLGCGGPMEPAQQNAAQVEKAQEVNAQQLEEWQGLEFEFDSPDTTLPGIDHLKDLPGFDPEEVVRLEGVTYLVLEGDLFMRHSEYVHWRAGWNKVMARPDRDAVLQDRMLVPYEVDGVEQREQRGDTMDYTVDSASFRSAARYRQVVDALQKAARDWSGLCNIHFRHRKALDAQAGILALRPGIDFVVRACSTGNFRLKACFPHTPVAERIVYVNTAYFTDRTYNKVGMFRHELGHILGFLHEHVRPGAPRSCVVDSVGVPTPLGTYDSVSVMHYFCGGLGNPRLSFSRQDSIFARDRYPF